MSSMFKKKTGLAFKPKRPSARPRPPPAQAAPPTPTDVTEVPTIDQSIEKAPEDARDQAVIDAGENNGGEPEASPPPASPAPPPPSVSKVADESSTSRRPPTPPPTIEQEVHQPRPSLTHEDATSATDASQVPAAVAEKATPEVPTPGETTPAPIEHTPTTSDLELLEGPSIEEAPAATASATASATETTTAPNGDPPAKATKPRAPRSTRKTAAEKTPEDAEAAKTPQTRKRQRKPPASKNTLANGEEAAEEGVEDGEEAPAKPKRRRASAAAGAGGASKPRRARSLTPEGAESQMVDLTKLKMSDLTEDLRIGKKFSRHDELRERERKRRLKVKASKDGGGGPAAGEEEGEDQQQQQEQQQEGGGGDQGNDKTPGSQEEGGGGAGPAGPQFRIVDGQIVVDQSSLVMDRHARAAAAQGAMETVEENDFTRLITSSSFSTNSKLRGPNIWSEPETRLFYRALRMFGTDFEMMSRMFAGKRRRHVKLKFNREERRNPHLVNAALTGEKTVKMDIGEYQALTGAELESVESIEAEQRRVQEGYEAEQKRIADEQAEVMRRKREELFADDDDEGGGKGKKKGRKKRQVIEYGLNGEPIHREEV